MVKFEKVDDNNNENDVEKKTYIHFRNEHFKRAV